MPTERDYGRYKPQKSISGRLKVAEGKTKNPTAKQQPQIKEFQPPGVIQRGDRSKTLWARRKKRMSMLGTTEHSNLDPVDDMSYHDPELETVLDQYIDDVSKAFIAGDIDMATAEALVEFAEEGANNQAVIIGSDHV